MMPHTSTCDMCSLELPSAPCFSASSYSSLVLTLSIIILCQEASPLWIPQAEPHAPLPGMPPPPHVSQHSLKPPDPASLSVCLSYSLTLFLALSLSPHLSVSLSLSLIAPIPLSFAHLLYPLLAAGELCLGCGTDSSSMSSPSCRVLMRQLPSSSNTSGTLGLTSTSWKKGIGPPGMRDYLWENWGLGAGEEFLGT